MCLLSPVVGIICCVTPCCSCAVPCHAIVVDHNKSADPHHSCLCVKVSFQAISLTLEHAMLRHALCYIGILTLTKHPACLCSAISPHHNKSNNQHTPTNYPSAWLCMANLQSISPLVHAASACQDEARVGVLHPLLHLALELATPSKPGQEGLQVVTVKISPATDQVHFSQSMLCL